MQCNTYIYIFFYLIIFTRFYWIYFKLNGRKRATNSWFRTALRVETICECVFHYCIFFAFLNNTWVSNLILTPCKRASLGQSPSFQIRKLFKIFVYLYRQIKSSFFPLKPEFFLKILTHRLLAINSKKQICVIFKKNCSFVHL